MGIMDYVFLASRPMIEIVGYGICRIFYGLPLTSYQLTDLQLTDLRLPTHQKIRLCHPNTLEVDFAAIFEVEVVFE